MGSDTTNPTEAATSVVPGSSGLSDLTTFGKVRLAAFALVVLATIGMAGVALGELFSLLVLGWTADTGAELGIHRLHVMGIAATIFTTLLGVIVQLYRPTRQATAMLGAFLSVVAAAAITVGVGGPLEGVLPFLVLISLATVLHPAGRDLLQRGESYSPAMLALVAVAAVPMLAFAADQVTRQLTASDPHAAVGHYSAMAQFAVVPLVYAGLAAIGMRGWRVAAWVGALPVAYYGLLAVSFTGQTGSTGVTWGSAAVLWAASFVVVTEYSRSGDSPTLRRSAAEGD
ncbi:hypothetical protein [Halorarius litoreus]|uniref:hypothetical protein n=1 Tax=Halorarius litoreus TaxID=2962676 RepID=UPI0020CD9EA1|nr:hypothetical protein [Halorarius litoreus]